MIIKRICEASIPVSDPQKVHSKQWWLLSALQAKSQKNMGSPAQSVLQMDIGELALRYPADFMTGQGGIQCFHFLGSGRKPIMR